ncbi:uncharacterized protein BDV14DRAFT_207787 [Aspergillus stella-maris]|uniref:uncharacterized protein n=1 Tax=Aspergillus stella-maris TaxID=1810926 RepID=UPI003CCDB99C
MSLDQTFLQSTILPATQIEIASRFWGSGSVEARYLRPYFQYYTDQCRIVYLSHKAQLPVKTHQDLVDIAIDIRDNFTRQELKDKLIQKYASSEPVASDALDASIDLTVRLVCMLDVGDLPNVFSGRRKLIWSHGLLQDFMQELFPEKVPLNHDGLRLGRDFNISNMVRIGGFKVELTTNLADHLRLRDTDRTVSVFHHASFLKGQRHSTLFPAGLIDETFATLSLLFPHRDRACERWYNKQEPSDELDQSVLKCGPSQRRIEQYNYWHDRLVILKEEFDESRPSTLSQWWNDRREGTQWYTFWVAISLTLLFGLFQSITGAMQVYKAYHP